MYIYTYIYICIYMLKYEYIHICIYKPLYRRVGVQYRIHAHIQYTICTSSDERVNTRLDGRVGTGERSHTQKEEHKDHHHKGGRHDERHDNFLKWNSISLKPDQDFQIAHTFEFFLGLCQELTYFIFLLLDFVNFLLCVTSYTWCANIWIIIKIMQTWQ